ncbi:alpha-S1-casein precursor [Cricetulus griseus]|uniref:Alpha-S1-casein n=1 Tax=Cricetulus griseus TaxID=10029 RepID=A0A061INB5_CRIGR|nr:alpha-S1-casein precursor [Cricetulus griseus]
MKLLILTCLVAAALAMPEQQKFIELPTYIGLDEEQAMGIAQAKHISSEDMLNQCTLEQPYEMNAYNQFQMGQPMSVEDQAFPQFYEHGSSPLWAYLPQDVQYFTPESVLNTMKPIGSNNEEGTKVWCMNSTTVQCSCEIFHDVSNGIICVTKLIELDDNDQFMKMIMTQPNKRFLCVTFIMAVVLSVIVSTQDKVLINLERGIVYHIIQITKSTHKFQVQLVINTQFPTNHGPLLKRFDST